MLAVDDVSLDLAEGELHAVIGPNGAGKTTLIHLLSGALKPSAGTIVLDGRDITGLAMHRRVRLGLARSYQITSVFPNFTVLENLALALQGAGRPDDRDRARAELDAVGLGDRADQLAGALAHGERRQLELGLALATGARILLLDEPMAGMGPEEAARILGLLETLKRRRTILLVEHDMDAVFRLADRISTLVYGRVIASGAPDEIRRHPEVRRAYLGEEGRRMTPLLEVVGVQAGYGTLPVLFGVDLAIKPGEAVTLLGRNGMGKTTTVRCIVGLLKATSGMIRFEGRRIDGWTADRIGRAGIALVPEGRRIFPNLSVRENLIAFAADRRGAATPWTLERVYALFPRLAERADNMGSQLSGGEQQMLAIGRALMTNPKLLILDEATEGLAPLLREEIWRVLAELRRTGLAILAIDKYVDRLVKLAERHTILERGRVAWAGASAELAADRGLWERYLGV